MSIFANKDLTFDTTLRWKTFGSVIVILPDDKGNETAAAPAAEASAVPAPVPVAPVTAAAVAEDPKIPVESVTVKFRYPSYLDERAITRGATQPDQNGIPVVNILTLQNLMLSVLIKEWDLKDGKSNAVPINDVTIGDLHPMIARVLVARLYGEMASKGSIGLF